MCWFLVTYPLAQRREAWSWYALVVSLGLWFVVDSTASLVMGYWQNAVLNSLFALLFGAPLFATRYVAVGSASVADKS